MIRDSPGSKEERFQDLCDLASHCNLCESMSTREKILSSLNGSLSSRILFVAEAPGRLGADRTGVPLQGDKTGENFEELMRCVGWRREEVFATNAVLCNPREENGVNRTPSSAEVANCSPYLAMTISLLDPEVIVTLGSTALNSLRRIRKHRYQLSEHVGIPVPWSSRLLFPLYHPGPRAMVHRPRSRQVRDFRKLSATANPKTGLNREAAPKLADYLHSATEGQYSALQDLIFVLVSTVGHMSYFKLAKLLYLVDLHSLKEFGRTISGEIYLRQKEGPWPPGLRMQIKALQGWEIDMYFRGRRPFVQPGPSPRFIPRMGKDQLDIVNQVVQQYGRLADKGMMMAVYRTNPMRFIREKEKMGQSMYNAPVIFKGRSIDEEDRS